MIELLACARMKWWHWHRFGAEALARQGAWDAAIAYADGCRAPEGYALRHHPDSTNLRRAVTASALPVYLQQRNRLRAPAAPTVPHLPRFRALALFRRRPLERVESSSLRRPKTCTRADLPWQSRFSVSERPMRSFLRNEQ
jgi:hypothetical protein